MENDLDLTLRLGLPNPNPTVETHLSLSIPTSDQGINVDGRHNDNNDGGQSLGLRHLVLGKDAMIDNNGGARNNVKVNIRMYNHVSQHFTGVGNTLNFASYPMPPPPTTPAVRDCVVIDVPPRRAQRNNCLAIANALDANSRHRGCGGGRIEEARKCTNVNCNAVSTPMWRRGPLGPKTLCNACGIKFRKEQERKSKRN